MKNLRTSAIGVCLMLMSVCSFAQRPADVPINEPNYNKPKLFDGMPDRIPVDMNNAKLFFLASSGQQLNVSLSASLRVDGEIVSVSNKYNNTLRSVVVNCKNFNNARLTLSMVTAPDGTVSYTGRMVSFQHGDLYELQRKENDFYLVKRNFYELINE